MNKGFLPVLGVLSCTCLDCPFASGYGEASADRFEFIDNGLIRVGVDASRRGVIGYLAPSDNSVANVINVHRAQGPYARCHCSACPALQVASCGLMSSRAVCAGERRISLVVC